MKKYIEPSIKISSFDKAKIVTLSTETIEDKMNHAGVDSGNISELNYSDLTWE